MPDLPDLAPQTDADYARVLDYIRTRRAEWKRSLDAGRDAIAEHLTAAGFVPFTAESRSDVIDGTGRLGLSEVVVTGRLKDPDAIVAKMRRYGEPLRVMLDVFGYRLIVATEGLMDAVANHCTVLWATPTPAELLLRHGQLQFQPWRDYRRRDHAGLSAATTNQYDEAIHLNRRAPFGIVEVQVLTYDLYRRVHCDPDGADSHAAFVARRQALLRKDNR